VQNCPGNNSPALPHLLEPVVKERHPPALKFIIIGSEAKESEYQKTKTEEMFNKEHGNLQETVRFSVGRGRVFWNLLCLFYRIFLQTIEWFNKNNILQ
jgi:hypothetical protein